MILTGVIVLFLPLGVTVLLSGTDAVSIQKQIDMETYLPAILCEQVPWDYEEEMLKEQPVLLSGERKARGNSMGGKAGTISAG